MSKKLFLLLTTLTLVGCAPTPSSDTTPESTAIESSTREEETIEVTIQLEIKDQPTVEKEITIEEGASALDALKQAFDVKEEDGFVSEIDGHANDDATSTYWMYEVNGQMAEVGANEYVLDDNDTMTWTLETF